MFSDLNRIKLEINNKRYLEYNQIFVHLKKLTSNQSIYQREITRNIRKYSFLKYNETTAF